MPIIKYEEFNLDTNGFVYEWIHMASYCSSRRAVYIIRCLNCSKVVCRRAIRSVLLSNAGIKLYSTNDPTGHVKCIGDSYVAYSCQCLIADTSCGCCRIILGYHILRPCASCMAVKNNGHLWMFDVSSVSSNVRGTDHRGVELSDSFMFYNEYDHEIKIR